MATIVNTNLAGFTVKYNGVQFGGADATYESLPPMYFFRGMERWDESGRSVMGMDYTLTVRCIFFEISETAMAANMRAIRTLLSVPGRLLEIRGLGTGFGILTSLFSTPSGAVLDLANGPHPGPVECAPIGGQLSWELAWSINFFVSECATSQTSQLAFLAFNFTTTWRNDFEGLTQRTISGHAIIPQYRNPNIPKTVIHVAEETRGSIIVSIPPNFARIENTWRESDDKSRLDFSIVDEQLEGDALPEGISAGDGSFGISAGDGKGGFAQGIASLSMSLKTAPNKHRNLAGQIFMVAALSKQTEMQTGLPAASTVIPLKISIVNGKFARARQTECSMVWQVTSCLNAMLTATGIWTPVSTLLENGGFGSQDYTRWKASMAALWDNKGTSQIGSSVSEAVIIDLCDNVTTKTIGTVGSVPNDLTEASLPSLTCPEVPATGGWLRFELKVRILRQDKQTLHRKAVPYLPGTVTTSASDDPGTSDTVNLGGSEYSQTASDQHVVEHHGYPETYIGVTFKGLRYKNKPFMPKLVTVNGMNVIEVSADPGSPEWAFDVFGCPVWALRGWRVYRVPGYVQSTKAIGSKASCSNPTPPTAL